MWPYGGRALRPPSGSYQLATARTFAHTTRGCQDQSSETTCDESPRTMHLDAAGEVGDDPVAVAAVDRLDELDDLVAPVAAEALEEERGRVQRHAERRRLLLVRHRRLDGLDPAGDDDAVPVAQQRVERPGLEVGRREARHERFPHVQRLDRHRLATREPEPFSDDDRLRRRDVQEPAEARARGYDFQLEGARRGRHAAAAHVVREGRQRQLLGDLRLADEGAGAAPPHEVALADELVEGGADGQARDAEVCAQLPLRGDGLAHAELLDQVEHAVASLGLLRHVVKTTSGSGGAGVTASRLFPVLGSKKWKRAGSTARRRRVPISAFVRGSTRALKSAFSSTRSVSSSSLASRASVVEIRGASTWKKTWTSEPSSSSTSISASMRGISGGAKAESSKLSGRRPRTTERTSRGGRRTGSSGTRNWPKTASSPSIRASTRFIAGVPMNAATKRSTGCR